jgi:hypothetical protein
LEGASVINIAYLITGLNLYPYTSIPLSLPSERILRVTISTGMPISTSCSPKSVSWAVTTGTLVRAGWVEDN